MYCLLCEEEGGIVLWRDDFCRVVRVPGAEYPGLCRVVLNRHVREMTDLADAESARLMRAVFATESVLRGLFQPDKINLASFGNQVPHLHWHVIPRNTDDPHFPDPSWGPARRPASANRPGVSGAAIAAKLAELLG
ncbi:MAG: HIT family protein [Betaproteobacteria bacterium]|nr:HIT family protein [Betaproteobacteria bacterium]